MIAVIQRQLNKIISYIIEGVIQTSPVETVHSDLELLLLAFLVRSFLAHLDLFDAFADP